MGVITSTMRMVDGSTSIIQKNITIMGRMIDVIEQINRAGSISGLENDFNDIRSEISVVNHELEVFNQSMHETGETGAAAANKVKGGFGWISKSVVVANQAVSLLKQGYQELSGFMRGSDERSSADARLANIRDELHSQEQLEAQVMAVANATRTEYGSTAELIAKMGRQDYFKGQNDKALAFAKTLNQGLIVSGATATEVNSTLLQLSQGIASGVLRGEEFNSIMENGSVLAEMMAASLGVTKGELRAMAQDGQLTADVVVSSIMQQANVIEEQFSAMPVTFGQMQNQFSNLWSQVLDDLAQANQPINGVIRKMEELSAWLSTMEGQQFMSGLASGIGFVLEGLVNLAQLAGDTYLFFSNNWTTIEPIMWGVGTAVAALTTALLVYKGIALASAAANAIQKASLMLTSGATLAATAAQWGLNTALLACPLTWIIVAVVAVIAVFIALSIWLYRLWQTNIDFRVGVIQVWNGLLGFFDQVPIFFQSVGNGVLDAFSYMKVGAAIILQNMINDTISKINALISLVNNIPGVSIQAVAAVDFGTQTAIEEDVKRQARAADLQASRDNATLRAVEREAELAETSSRWRQEAAEKEAALVSEQKKANEMSQFENPDFGAVELGGGTIDKVNKIGGEVDISNQSLAYLRDIAELRALESVNAYSTIAYQGISEARLSDGDAELLKSSSNFNTNVYYLNYSGGVRIKSDVHNGQDWDSIKQSIMDETNAELETGLDGIYTGVAG